MDVVSDEQKAQVEECVSFLAKLDGQAIDSLAKTLKINQAIIYAFYIEFHKAIFKEMYGVEL